MLTKNDATVIKKIVDDAVGPVKTDISGLKQGVSGLKAGQSRLEKGIKGLEGGLRREHKIGGEILNYLEKEDKKIKERVDKIEFHLGIAPN